MRTFFPSLPILLATLSLPGLAAQSEPPKPAPTHIIQVLRPGQGLPRVRDAAAARTVPLSALDQTDATKRSRPYQVAKPGEGAPKG